MLNEIDRFLSTQGRRWATTTLARYRWYLRNLAGYYEGSLSREVSEAMIVRWLDARSGWAPTTQYVAIVAARAFFRWAVGRASSPVEAIALPRRPGRPQRTLDELRLRRILESLDTASAKGIRDTAIVLLLLDSGLRAAEVCRLRQEHVDLGERRFVVLVKGGRWAQGVFSAYTAGFMTMWTTMRKAAPGVPEFFVGIGGKTSGGRLTGDGLRAIFRQLGERVGFHFSPHDFRRTFATMALRNGAPSRLVQIAGRWNSLEMVERYSQALTAEDFDPWSPVSQLMGLRVKHEER